MPGCWSGPVQAVPAHQWARARNKNSFTLLSKLWSWFAELGTQHHPTTLETTWVRNKMSERETLNFFHWKAGSKKSNWQTDSLELAKFIKIRPSEEHLFLAKKGWPSHTGNLAKLGDIRNWTCRAWQRIDIQLHFTHRTYFYQFSFY